ncbi:collectrin [Nerophis lumbriciformis]|uniref:collectrin n=1 Tax=Nerophis lumbriciformis TaxID=546530 RepID=UPI002ADF059E|nr:collectrin-like [Nerophis lumbriciformis]
MLDKWTFLLCLLPSLAQDLCTPGASDGYKVRLSIQTALGDDAYVWNPNEMFLFRATLAFAMRNHFDGQDFQVSNILVCEETLRVSFWFVVTLPGNTSHLLDREHVQMAVRKSRSRINSAFLLTDRTLEFVGITPTLAAPVLPDTPPWLIAFGVVMGAVGAAFVVLLAFSAVQKRRNKKTKTENTEDTEDLEDNEKTVGNGRARQDAGGVSNVSFLEDERVTHM